MAFHTSGARKRPNLISSLAYQALCFSLLSLNATTLTLPALANQTVAPSTEANSQSAFQLPKHITPESYDLTFTPDLEKFTFDGSSKITINVAKPTSTVTLNSLDIEINKATIASTSDKTMTTGTVSLDAEHEKAVITFPSMLQPGTYVLELAFKGILNDKLRGFYRSYNTDDQGAKHWLATTQMEPTDARRMFPCFDEPEMKASFKMTAIIPPALVAISNGAVYSEKLDKETGKKIVSFEASPKMSSYLVALIIGNFKSSAQKTACGVPIRVWALEGKEKLTEYPLAAACKILEYQTDYFGIPYPGKKLDLIAIPDFRSGAMENLGAVTFREANLLVDEKTGSNFSKRTVVAIIAHELAHQWFGDLVTMKWWDDIWLNEAFASWMGTKTVDAIHPEWQELTKAIFTRNGSMQIDELKATRAIHADVSDPKQAAEMFDGITYDKGESILWMLEGFVGRKHFQEGIHQYLANHTFGNATSEDLWQSIGRASSLPVPEVMKSWVFQPGFPVLRVGTIGDTNQLALTQARFFGLPGLEPDELTWSIPTVIRPLQPTDKQDKSATQVVSKKADTVTLPDGWNSVIVNAGGRGYFRTHYAAEQQSKILSHFDWLSVEERLAYLSDINALVGKGVLPVNDKLAISLKVAKETDPLVQEKLIDWCRHPYFYLDASEKASYERLMTSMLKPLLSKIGWEETASEPDSTKDLRKSLIHMLGTLAQDKETIAESRQLYTKYMKDRKAIPPDIASTVLGVVAYNGGASEYDEIVGALKVEKVPELEKRFLHALVSFSQPDLVDKTLNMVLSEEVRSQDGFRVLSGLLEHHRTNHRTWDYIKSHWDAVTKKFPPRSMSALVSSCVSFDLPEEESDLKSFFATHELPFAKSAVSRMLEDVHIAVLYRQRNQAEIKTWVKQEAANAGQNVK